MAHRPKEKARREAASGELVSLAIVEGQEIGLHDVATRESAMAKKQGGSKPKAQSAMGPIAHALIQGYLGPDQRVIDMERFFTALMQALHDAYALGWKDRGEIERAK